MVQNVSTPRTPTKHIKPIFFIFMVILVGLGIYMATRPLIEIDEDGNHRLAKWLRDKRDREIERLYDAEQYVLWAIVDGWYTCYSCVGSKKIYLRRGMVWKYGVSINGKARYTESFLNENNLNYETQFKGPLTECLEQEKIKIYGYLLLPENLARKNPLPFPPGHKIRR